MHLPFACPRPRLSATVGGAPGEGRNCELSQRMTALVLFPRLDVARPGPWLLLLAAACSYVAVRALELGLF